jgi:hypothetical protein
MEIFILCFAGECFCTKEWQISHIRTYRLQGQSQRIEYNDGTEAFDLLQEGLCPWREFG